jgi:hypothetical protein
VASLQSIKLTPVDHPAMAAGWTGVERPRFCRTAAPQLAATPVPSGACRNCRAPALGTPSRGITVAGIMVAVGTAVHCGAPAAIARSNCDAPALAEIAVPHSAWHHWQLVPRWQGFGGPGFACHRCQCQGVAPSCWEADSQCGHPYDGCHVS